MGWLGLGGAIQKGFIAEVALEVDLWGGLGVLQVGLSWGFHRRHPPCSPGTSLCNVSVNVMSVSYPNIKEPRCTYPRQYVRQ